MHSILTINSESSSVIEKKINELEEILISITKTSHNTLLLWQVCMKIYRNRICLFLDFIFFCFKKLRWHGDQTNNTELNDTISKELQKFSLFTYQVGIRSCPMKKELSFPLQAFVMVNHSKHLDMLNQSPPYYMDPKEEEKGKKICIRSSPDITINLGVKSGKWFKSTIDTYK